MTPFYCIMFSHSISDEVRDTLLAHAYLMLRSYKRKTKVRTNDCEGVIETDFKETHLYGMNGIVFKARLGTNAGDLKVSYLVRHQDLEMAEEAEHGAWLEPDEFDSPLPPSKLRKNPIRAVSKAHLGN